MPVTYYREALKLGQKEFRTCTAKGVYPYLSVLDAFVPSTSCGQGTDLGLIPVPMEFVVGTKSQGRASAFARNFMPLAPEKSEMADKWKKLCQTHLEEGIRDPVRAWEYMNRYYVEEGHKRVSILKFFGADTVYAQVIRVPPQHPDSREAHLYREWTEFFHCSGLNAIECTRLGSYMQMQALLGKSPGALWSSEERKDFLAAYYCFREAYQAKGGRHLSLTAGDAMLAYMKVYGFQELQGKSLQEMKKQVEKVWEEITLQQEEPATDVKLAPEDTKEKSGSLLSWILPKSKPELRKAAFIHDGSPELAAWTQGHEEGRLHVERVFSGQLETQAQVVRPEEDALSVIEQKIASGCRVIFTTSPNLLTASLRAAVDHPDLFIINCSLNKPHRYIRTYFIRMYEAQFALGAIAGSLAGSNPVGYICGSPLLGQTADVNAFALGVQMVNPRSKVFLENSLKALENKEVPLAAFHDGASGPGRLSLLRPEGPVLLAAPFRHWGNYYEAMLRRIQSGAFQAEYEESGRALHYYWGMSAGVVGLQCSEKLPDSARKLAELLRSGISSGSCEPFGGPLYDQKHRRIAGDGESLSLEQIINMDWLVENIEGALPEEPVGDGAQP